MRKDNLIWSARLFTLWCSIKLNCGVNATWSNFVSHLASTSQSHTLYIVCYIVYRDVTNSLQQCCDRCLWSIKGTVVKKNSTEIMFKCLTALPLSDLSFFYIHCVQVREYNLNNNPPPTGYVFLSWKKYKILLK